MNNQIQYWNEFYKKDIIPLQPSKFAIFVDNFFNVKDEKMNIVDCGCGNGRDSYYLSKKHNVLGIDIANKPSDKDSKFILGDFCNYNKDNFDIIYSRFTFHSITNEKQKEFVTSIKEGSYLCIETRSDKSSNIIKEHGDTHYRNYTNVEYLTDLLYSNNFKILYLKEDKGFAIYKKEDPICIRLIAQKMTKEELFRECLEDMKEILDDNIQQYFLAWGTLLGCFREGQFISYDGDIDLGILEENFDSSIVEKILNSKKFKLFKKYGDEQKKNLEYTFVHKNSVRIDIFIFYEIEKDYYYTSTFNDICSKKEDGFCKWGRHIRGFNEIDFYNKKYLIPSNTEEHLIESYGDDYMTPKKFNYFQGIRGMYKNLIN